MTDVNQDAFAAMIDAKLVELRDIPYGRETGRRLSVLTKEEGQSSDPSEIAVDSMLRQVIAELITKLGPYWIEKTPAVAIEQFVLMSINKNHDTSGLLVSLLNSFLLAYLTPETSSSAFAHLQGLQALCDEIQEERDSASVSSTRH